MKACKGAERKIAAVEGGGGAEPNQKPSSDAQKTKLTKVTEKLMAMKGKVEDVLNEDKEEKFREMITKHARSRAGGATVLVVGSSAEMSGMLDGGVGNAAACLAASVKEVQERMKKAHTNLDQQIKQAVAELADAA